ncbi:MAG: NAD(P)/FAD-dependent oxidoreductase [Candidatus Omnitrophica bacterium]|nr:NAD(P)/FAD-dependent oxidoreductase [Candidatus Omnitrophota bacterium]
MKNNYECIVVGGGVAGSTAAYHLKKLGYDVAVLEKTHGPHHKVCGEFLSFEAHIFLKEMGISLDDSPAVKYFQLYSPHSKVGFTFPFPGRGISRYKLDEQLLNNTKEAGVDIFRGVYMRGYHKEENGLYKIETNTGNFYARHIFIATGKHDYSKEHKRRGKDHSYLGLKTHIFLNSRRQDFKETTMLFSFPGGYGGICPIEGEATNFCFVIDKALYKSFHGDFDAAVSYLRRSNPQLDAVLQHADFIAPVCAVGEIPYGFISRRSHHGNVYFLGDQRSVIPSFTGDGMAIALSTAKDCVYEFHCRQKNLPFETKSMQRKLKKQMHWALLAHAILKTSWLLNVCVSVPPCSRFLIETFFKNTRVSLTKNIYSNDESTVLENIYSRR